MFDQEWNKMLTMISNDINITEFYDKFLKNKESDSKTKRGKFSQNRAKTQIRSSIISKSKDNVDDSELENA